MNCQRCHKEQPPSHRITSDKMVVDVCDQCAVDAWRITQWQALDQPGAIRITPIKEAVG